MDREPITAAFRVVRRHPAKAVAWLTLPDQWTGTEAFGSLFSQEQAEQIAEDWQTFANVKGIASMREYHAEPAPVRFVDMTPTWRQAAQIIAAALENGTDKGRDAARAELFRMADILDQLKAEQDAEKGRAEA